MGHDIGSALAALAVMLAAAKLAGHLAARAGQPAVLGEILAGVLVGNLPLVGFDGLAFLADDRRIAFLAELGVILLLFEVGLESTVREMAKVGGWALAVAVAGVVTPMALGWGTAALLLPDASPYVAVFLGATLCATSVGITARVLKDLGRAQGEEARIILGAAVIDDVLGLIVLATVSGIIGAAATGGVSGGDSVLLAAGIAGKAAAFLVGAVAVGWLLTPRLFRAALRLRVPGVLLALGLATCFLFSAAAAAVGLAPIVGAFAAGLVLEPVHYKDFVDRGEHELEELVGHVGAFLTPVFFVLMGSRVDLRTFADGRTLALALALTLAALLGKGACALPLPSRLDRLSVGIGMIPRGEVGLIFAGVGLGLSVAGRPVLAPALYGAVVAMVILTTLVTPPALKWSLGRRAGRSP